MLLLPAKSLAVKLLCYVTTPSDSEVTVLLLLIAKSLAVKLPCYVSTPSKIHGSEDTVLCYYFQRHPWQQS
jgi:hypothetical protein